MISFDTTCHRGRGESTKTGPIMPLQSKKRCRRRQRLTRAQAIGHMLRKIRYGRYKELTRKVFLNPLRFYEQPDWVHRARLIGAVAARLCTVAERDRPTSR